MFYLLVPFRFAQDDGIVILRLVAQVFQREQLQTGVVVARPQIDQLQVVDDIFAFGGFDAPVQCSGHPELSNQPQIRIVQFAP